MHSLDFDSLKYGTSAQSTFAGASKSAALGPELSSLYNAFAKLVEDQAVTVRNVADLHGPQQQRLDLRAEDLDQEYFLKKKKLMLDDNDLLRERCARLQKELQDNTAQFGSLVRMRREGGTPENALQSIELEQLQKEKRQLNKLLKDTLQEKEELNNKLIDLRTENRVLRSDLNDQRLKTLDEDTGFSLDLIRSKELLAIKETELEEARIEKNKFQDLYEDLLARTEKDKQAAIDRGEKEKHDLEKNLQELVRSKLEIERNSQDKRDKVAEADLSLLRERNDALKILNENLTEEISELKAALEARQKRRGELEGQLLVADNRRIGFESDCELAKNKLQLSEQSKLQLLKQLDIEKRAAAEKDQELEDVRRALSDTKLKNEKLNRDLQLALEKHSNLEAELLRLTKTAERTDMRM